MGTGRTEFTGSGGVPAGGGSNNRNGGAGGNYSTSSSGSSFEEGLAEIPIIGDALQALGLVDNPYTDDVMRSLGEARKQYEEYRPEALNARVENLNRAMGLLGPANNMLGKMYGTDAMSDFSTFSTSPFDPMPMQSLDVGAMRPHVPGNPTSAELSAEGERRGGKMPAPSNGQAGYVVDQTMQRGTPRRL